MGSPQADREATALLAMARKMRYGLTQRDEFVKPYRERYDQCQDDLRMAPQKRVGIASEFLRAAYRADHLYEDCVEEALEVYREAMRTEGEPRR
jgi:hypothetical protein